MPTKATFKATCQIGQFLDLQNWLKTVPQEQTKLQLRDTNPIHHIHVCNHVVKYINVSG